MAATFINSGYGNPDRPRQVRFVDQALVNKGDVAVFRDEEVYLVYARVQKPPTVTILGAKYKNGFASSRTKIVVDTESVIPLVPS